MDAQVITWATQQPHDWQFGGKCDVYMWGSGRHGQLGDAGTSEAIISCNPLYVNVAVSYSELLLA